jgi:hypothetical protein
LRSRRKTKKEIEKERRKRNIIRSGPAAKQEDIEETASKATKGDFGLGAQM